MNKETFDSLHKHGIEHMHVQVPPREGIENRKKKLEDIEDERCREDENAKQLLGLIERRRLEYLACLGNINVLDQPPDLAEAALARMVLKILGFEFSGMLRILDDRRASFGRRRRACAQRLRFCALQSDPVDDASLVVVGDRVVLGTAVVQKDHGTGPPANP